MENSMSRILIETTVRQTLKGLQDDPKRSIRNVVNMALHFSDGRFQSRFSGLPRPCWNMRTAPIMPWWRTPPTTLTRNIW